MADFEIERLYSLTCLEIKKYKSLSLWLDQAVIPKYKCTVLVFYRGAFCSACNKYLEKWQQLQSEIKTAGGAVFAVSSQPKEKVKKQMVSSGTQVPLIADPWNKLAKRFNIPVLKRCQTSFYALQDLLRGFGGNSSSISPESDFKDGMVQPAVLILDQSGKELFSWRGKIPTNPLGVAEMADPAYLIRLSLGGILPTKREDQRLPRDFDEMMKSPEAKAIFRDHLEKIYCAEMLLFLDQVEEINAKCRELAERFILDSGSMQVNISSEVRAEPITGVFANAYAEVKQSAFLEYAKFIVVYNAALPAPQS